MKARITLFLTIVLAASALAYPISPRPLRKLIMESEYILAAHVNKVSSKEREKKDEYGNTIAELKVIGVFQGKIKDSVIHVSYSRNMICPAPPHFTEDTDVVVFLDREKTTYRVHALSYGVRTVSANDFSVYKDRIQEMQQILKIENKDQQFLQTTEWLVKCAEQRATRYDGTYELNPSSNFMSYYDQTENPPFKFILNTDQKARLKSTLLTASATDYTDFGLIDLVYAGNEKEIFDLMFSRITQIAQNDYWFANEYMERLCLYKSSPSLQQLAKEYDETRFETKDQTKLKKLIDQFVNEMKLL